MQRQNTLLYSFFKYTSANVAGMIGLSCYILADTFFISMGLGSLGLTALNLSIPVYGLIHSTGLMIGIGAGTGFAIERAQKNREKGNRFFTCALLLAVFASLFFVVLGLFFTREIALVFGADKGTLSMTVTYMRTILLFSPAFLLNNVLIAFVRNDKNPRLSMMGMLVGSFSNIILDYIFIFPLSMGIFGAAFATGLAPVISIGILLTHFGTKKNSFSIVVGFSCLRQSLRILSLGISTFVTEFASSIVIIVFNFILLSFSGNTGVAAYGIIANLSLVITSIFTGISQGIQPVISKAYGEGRRGDIHTMAKYGITLTLSLSIILYVCLIGLRSPLVHAFNQGEDQKLQIMAERGVIYYFAAFPFVGFNIVIISLLNSVTRFGSAFFLSLLRGILLILPCAIIFSKLYDIMGVWLSFPITELLTGTLSLVFLVSFLRRKELY